MSQHVVIHTWSRALLHVCLLEYGNHVHEQQILPYYLKQARGMAYTRSSKLLNWKPKKEISFKCEQSNTNVDVSNSVRQNAPFSILDFKIVSAVPTSKTLFQMAPECTIKRTSLISTFSQQFQLPFKIAPYCTIKRPGFQIFVAIPIKQRNIISNCVRIHQISVLVLNIFSAVPTSKTSFQIASESTIKLHCFPFFLSSSN